MLTKKSAIICTAAAIAAIAPFATSSDAEAKRGYGIPYYERFETRGPERGYEGFVGSGHLSQYCSYHRKPRTRCFVTRSGRERCRVVSWSLVQHCH